MENELYDFSLNTHNMKDIPFDKYEKDFTFIVNGKRYETSRFVADILSPYIRESHFHDQSLNEFHINIKNKLDKKDHFEDFLNFATFQNSKLDFIEQQYYSQYFYSLGNIDEYFRVQPNYLQTLTPENIIEALISITKAVRIVPQNIIQTNSPITEIIKYAASHFEEINKDKMKKLNVDVLELIISSEALMLTNEDSLLKFVLSLYQEDHNYSVLFDYVFFFNVSEEVLENFIKVFEIEHIDDNIWKLICFRLLPSQINSQQFRSRYSGINSNLNIREFEYTEESEFNGIMRYLTEKTGGNIHDNETINITSNSIRNSNYYCQPKNLVDYLSKKTFYYQSKDEGGAYVCFDFKDRAIQLNSYSIKTANNEPYTFHLKNWVIEVSNNAKDWEEVDRHENDPSANKRFLTCTYNVQKDNDFHRFVRIRQTGNSWCKNDNHNCILFHLIEFYGKLKEP